MIEEVTVWELLRQSLKGELTPVEEAVYGIQEMKEWAQAGASLVAKRKEAASQAFQARKERYKQYEQVTFNTKG